jgi:uncharacterized protein
MWVTFARSGITVPWNESSENLLEFAEMHGIAISSGCRYGDCGTCMTRIVSGSVEYLHEVGATPDAHSCLLCSCRPSEDLVLDS